MAGASQQHVRISVNVMVLLDNQLKGRRCELSNGDMRVKVSPTGLYTYPDASVVCDRLRFEDKKLDTLLNPTLIVEILSKSTKAYGRGEKFAQYRTLDTLLDYLLVSQNKPRIERYTRQADGGWLLTEGSGLDAVMHITSIQYQLPLAEVYDRVEFDDAQPASKLTGVKEEAEAYSA